MKTIIILLALFGIKHFICDFVLQRGAMLKDKGVYGGVGGLTHAAIHALGTIIVLYILLPWNVHSHMFAILLGLLDGIIHYHIDYIKTNLSQGLTPNDHKFWIYFGADQGLHYLTYIGLIAIIVLL